MDLVLLFVALLLLVGAAILWRRTKRASSLLQLIASSVLFVVIALEQVAWFLAIFWGRSEFLGALRGSGAHSVQWFAFSISVVGFAIGYAWHGITLKRI